MTLLEYETTLDVLGIDKLENWNNLKIGFGSTYAIVNGEIPSEVLSNIYEKYPKNLFVIEVKNEEVDCDSNKSNTEEYSNTYHIDTKEGFIIFITEMMNYLLREKDLNRNEVDRYDDILREVNKKILSIVNPSIGGYQWMMRDNENKDLYLQSYNHIQQDDFSKLLRSLIKRFDMAVNPFEIDGDDLEKEQIIEKVVLSGDVASESDEENVVDERAEIYYGDLETNSFTKYIRDQNGFFYCLKSEICNEQFIVTHYFYNSNTNNALKGEGLSILIWDNGQELEDIRYNLTDDTIGSTYGVKKKATNEDKLYVYEQLEQAVCCASAIVLDKIQGLKEFKNVPKKN